MIKLLGLLGVLVFISFIYFKNIVKIKRASKLGDKIEKDPSLAIDLSNKLDSLIYELDCDYNIIFDKLSKLKFEMEILYHRIYKCHSISYNTFLIITTYEHLDTSSANSVEQLIPLNYKFSLDKSTNKVKIYSDNVMNNKLNDFKKSFLKGFFKKYINMTIEI